MGRRYAGPDVVRKRSAPEYLVAGRTNRGAANVGKRLVEEEKHTSIPRLLGATAGMGAVAWGGSRLRYLGPTLRAGREITQPVAPGVSAVLRQAERARHATERASAPLGAGFGHGLGRLPLNVRTSLNKIPPELRPPTAVLAGLLLTSHSRPVRHDTYRPVYIPGVNR